MPYVSVIVPIYKVEAHLERCLESLARQTFSDFEALLVDDGSPDRCGAIIDLWAQRDPRFIALHKENGGVNQARNAALAVAKGDFLLCVDPDDYVKPDHIDNLVRAQVRNGADLTIGRSVWVSAEDGRVLKTLPARGEVFARREEFAPHVAALLAENRLLYCTYKLYRRSVFGGLRFPEDMKVSGDNIWMAAVLGAARSIQLSDDDGYLYVRYEQGCITKQIHPSLYQYHRRVNEAMRATLTANGWLTPEAFGFLDAYAVFSMKGPVASVCRGPWPARQKVRYIEAMLSDPLFIACFDRLPGPALNPLLRMLRAGDGRAVLRYHVRLYRRRALVRRLPDWVRQLGRAVKRNLRAVRNASRRQPRAPR